MTAHLAAIMICVVSVVLGAAITCRPGQWSWTAPPAGLATAIVLALATVRLPGHGTTAALAIAAALALALIHLWRDRRVPHGFGLRDVLVPVALATAVLAFCSLPFLANQRVGELGASMLDDLTFHMGQADAMRRVGAAADVTSPGYPTGPHALVAALSAGTGVEVSPAFTGLLLAVPVLTALTALAVLGRAPPLLGAAGAAAVGVTYLAAAYLAQGAFKEPLLALFFLGFVLVLREAQASGPRPSHVAACVLVVAGATASFGLAALAWPAAALVTLGALSLARGGGRGRLRLSPRHKRLALAGALLLAAAVAVLAVGSRDFFDTGPGRYLSERGVGGNYIGQLHPLEALGVWPSDDFRLRPDGHGLLWPGLIVAASVCAYGAWWCWRRAEWALLGGGAAAIAVYVVARPVTLAYFSGKALVVAAPILTLIGVTGLIVAVAASQGRRRLLAFTALVTYLALLAYSSAMTLRGAHVRPAGRGADLADFRAAVQGQPTLYLGRDDFAGWELRGAKLWGFQNYLGLASRLEVRPAKAAGDHGPPAVDVDSIDSRFLDVFRYLIGPRTAFASRVPSNFRLVRRSRWHLLWERTGTTTDRRILDEGEAPGAMLDCARGEGRRLKDGRGSAHVRRPPVVGRAAAWRIAGSATSARWVNTAEERSARQRLSLAPGGWELSLRYFSDVPLRLRAPGLRTSLPPYVGDPSAFFAVGRMRHPGGPVTVEVTVPRRRFPDVVRTVEIGTVVATPVGDGGRRVRPRSACRRYVDWYSLAR